MLARATASPLVSPTPRAWDGGGLPWNRDGIKEFVLIRQEEWGALPSGWTTESQGTSSLTLLAPGDPNTDGATAVQFLATSSGALLDHHRTVADVRADQNPVLTARINLVAGLGLTRYEAGLSMRDDVDGLTTYVSLSARASLGGWSYGTSSGVGGGVGFVTSATPITEGWHVVRIDLMSGASVRFYVDGALIGEVLDPTAVPRGGELLGEYHSIQRISNTGGIYLLDRTDVQVRP